MPLDIGSEAIDRPTEAGGDYTWIVKNNPATKIGTITSIELWAAFIMTQIAVGTFYTTNGNTLKCRDSALLADVGSGAKVTRDVDSGGSPLAIAVEIDDFIGIYYRGNLERTNSGAGYWWKQYNHTTPDDEETYTFTAARDLSLGGYITEAPVGWTGKISGVTDPAKIMGVAVADIQSVKGVE